MDRSLIDKVWEQAVAVEGFNDSMIRKDCCGAWIVKAEYGNTDSEYGWYIDHVYPKVRGGDDNILNLRPVHWKNNIAKGSSFPVYYSAVTADGDKNVARVNQFKVGENLLRKLQKIYDIQA